MLSKYIVLLPKIKYKLNKAKSNPREAYLYILSLARGIILKFKYKCISSNIQIGKNFRARSNLIIKGPGKVVIGNNVTVDLSFLRTPTIITHTTKACVIIEEGTYLGGTRISCTHYVKIGKEGLFGSTTIIDSDVIPSEDMTINAAWIEKNASPVEIGDHFWAGTNTFILKGAKIGNECVLGAGGTVYNKSFPDRSLLIGNPARKIGSTK